jgi:hypothetical protein
MHKDLQDNDELDDLRQRLYSRDGAADAIERHGLSDTPVEVSRSWDIPKKQNAKPVMVSEPEPVAQVDVITPETLTPAKELESDVIDVEDQKSSRRYRVWILIGSLLVFIFGVGLSSLYLYLGGNQISSDNIALSVTGPFTIGGGETIDLQVGITNQNSVAIDSATLIMKYPPGTRSVGDAPRNLFEERIPIEAVSPGGVQNIPVQVAVFGESNVEQTISATIEYRIAGSNSLFYKDAEPLTFSITSSPLVLRIDSVEKVASGQVVDIEMTVISNASAPVRDVLISANYPNGFRFESADPTPVFSDNVWRIDELLPEQSVVIALTGTVVGLTEESFQINFNAGPARADNPFIVGSILAESSSNFSIERPFIDVETTIDGRTDRSVTIAQGETSVVDVNITNTLDETVYDMVVEVVPGGNALNEDSIVGTNGFYDSNSGTVRWEVSNNSRFAEVNPGESRELSFSVSPSAPQATASYDLVVNVYARRVAETSAAEQLIGTALIEAKYSSELFVGSQAGHGGLFTASGPLPPEVGVTTTYTITMVAEAGVNDLTDVILNTSLPVYVEWPDNVQGDGELVYNTVSKQIEWQPGNILSGNRAEVSFQIEFTPSLSQRGRAPLLVRSQSVRATDRFTGERLQASADPVYTELSTEAGYEEDNGVVQR